MTTAMIYLCLRIVQSFTERRTRLLLQSKLNEIAAFVETGCLIKVLWQTSWCKQGKKSTIFWEVILYQITLY